MTVNRGVSDVRPLRVALLGLGTVGAAVAGRLLDSDWRTGLAGRGTPPPDLVAVGVREPGRRRALALPDSLERTDDLDALAARNDVDVIVELLGGLEPAGRLIEAALARGASVVTANKALLAEHGPALEAAARRTGAALRFEAAVAAGIPLLAPLARDLAANHLDSVRGIVNGTTNFILSAMDAQGTDYADALADAQARGYAEADPSADVAGRDAAHKLVLLARIAFGAWLDPSAVSATPATVAGHGRPGITGVRLSEVIAATDRGMAIKLVASVSRPPDVGGPLVAFVEPCTVDRRSLIGSTNGVTNVVEVSGRPIGRVLFQGAGAGGAPTSSAVLGDLLALARAEGATWADLPAASRATALDDGRSQPARWFWSTPEGQAELTDAMPLYEARRRSQQLGVPAETPLYRYLEG